MANRIVMLELQGKAFALLLSERARCPQALTRSLPASEIRESHSTLPEKGQGLYAHLSAAETAESTSSARTLDLDFDTNKGKRLANKRPIKVCKP